MFIIFSECIDRYFMYNLLQIYTLCITIFFIKIFAPSSNEVYFHNKNMAFKYKRDAQWVNVDTKLK